jgi:hypothetical protein
MQTHTTQAEPFLNIRRWNGVTGQWDLFGQLYPGQKVSIDKVQESDSGWMIGNEQVYSMSYVISDEIEGWVASDYLIPIDPNQSASPAPIFLGVLGLVIFAIIFGKGK